jgi:hypothetical protein
MKLLLLLLLLRDERLVVFGEGAIRPWIVEGLQLEGLAW